jgi:hypothetical protein
MKELVDAVEVEDGHEGAGLWQRDHSDSQGAGSCGIGEGGERGATVMIIYICHEVFEY